MNLQVDATKPEDQACYTQGFQDFPAATFEKPKCPDAYKAGFLDAQALAEVEQIRLEILERRRLYAGGALERRVGFV